MNHDIDDAIRAGILSEADLPKDAVAVLGGSPSERIGRLVTDVVEQTLAGGLTEIRMSDEVLDAMLALRSFLFEAVYENDVATAEFEKAARHSRRAVGEGAGAAGGVPGPPDGRARGPGRGGPGFRRRHDRPVRR